MFHSQSPILSNRIFWDILIILHIPHFSFEGISAGIASPNAQALMIFAMRLDKKRNPVPFAHGVKGRSTGLTLIQVGWSTPRKWWCLMWFTWTDLYRMNMSKKRTFTNPMGLSSFSIIFHSKNKAMPCGSSIALRFSWRSTGSEKSPAKPLGQMETATYGRLN